MSQDSHTSPDPLHQVVGRIYLEGYFRALRFDPNHHLGLGDIRLTVGQQEDLIDILYPPNHKADVAPASGAHVQRVVGCDESQETKP